MEKVPFWKTYSYWVFFMTAIWVAGFLPFSPLVSAIGSLIGSLFILKQNSVSLFIFAIHFIPVWLLGKTSLDWKENVAVFLFYNLFLFALGTDMATVYEPILVDPPKTIKEYLIQSEIPIFKEATD